MGNKNKYDKVIAIRVLKIVGERHWVNATLTKSLVAKQPPFRTSYGSIEELVRAVVPITQTGE